MPTPTSPRSGRTTSKLTRTTSRTEDGGAPRRRELLPRSTQHEIIDGDGLAPSAIDANLRDIELANRLFGGYAPVVRALISRGDVTTVLDVGAGAGDVGRALVRAATRTGRSLHVTCLDRSDAMLDIARGRAGNDAHFTFVNGDGTALDFADASFDAVTCTLALHHFQPGAAVTLLSEMRRVARRVALVADLCRSPLGYAGAWLFARALSRSAITRHDAPLSARRAYTAREALALARESGWRSPVVKTTPFFRMLLADG